MNRFSYKALLLDTGNLFEEFMNEDHSIYKKLFDNLFDEKDKPNITSKRITINLYGTNNIDVSVFVDRHTDLVECFFVFNYDIDDIICELRENPTIRKLTKLCFYIEKYVGFYSSVLDSDNINDI